jgi:hypothetical protein
VELEWLSPDPAADGGGERSTTASPTMALRAGYDENDETTSFGFQEST